GKQEDRVRGNSVKNPSDNIGKRKAWQRIAPFLMYLILGAWAIWADPFGLSSASDKALSDELSRIRAYLNPVGPAPITVVSIDYESIKGLHNEGQGWMRANDWP